MNKLLIMILSVSTITGCMTAPDPANVYMGNTIDTLDAVVKSHVTETETIETEAKRILLQAKTTKVRNSAATILTSNSELQVVSSILADEVVAKVAIQKLIKEQTEYITKLESKEQRAMNRLMLIFKIVGFLCIVGGGYAALRISKVFWGVTGFGTTLIIAASVFKVIDKYSMLIGIVAILVAIGFVIKLYLSQKLTIKSAVRVAEVLKQELKVLAPDVVHTIFGKGDQPAVIAMAPESEKQINQARKEIRKDIAREDFKKKKENI